MRKLLFILSLLTSTLFGYSYNDLVVKAQSSIFPKILLLDKKLDEKLVNGTIVYTIVCEESDYHLAEALRDAMNTKYQNRLNGYTFTVNVLRFSELGPKVRTTAIYLLNSEAGIEKATRLAKDLGFMTFAYDIANLQHGVLLSLMVEKSTVLYLSKGSLQSHNVDFADALYRIVRFTQE